MSIENYVTLIFPDGRRDVYHVNGARHHFKTHSYKKVTEVGQSLPIYQLKAK